jgi:hypothetical protein
MAMRGSERKEERKRDRETTLKGILSSPLY